MRSFFVAFLLASLFYVSLSQDCSYTTYSYDLSETITYDLSSLENPSGYNFYDYSTSRYWYFNICGNLSQAYDIYGNSLACPSNSGACFTTYNGDGVFTSAGAYSNYYWSDSIYGVTQGVGITYGGGDDCKVMGDVTARAVHFEFLCDYNTYFTQSIISQDCYDTISVNTSYACPTYNHYDSDSYSYSYHHHHGKYIPLVIFVVSFLSLGIICICCVCCCVHKRKHCATKCGKEVEMSHVPFQPLPQQPPQMMVQQPLAQPMFMPMQQMSRPQNVPYMPMQYAPPAGQMPSYFYYPQQPVQVAQQPVQVAQQQPVQIIEQKEVVSEDEKLARDLQSKYDNEN
jgi:hypothetical protein